MAVVAHLGAPTRKHPGLLFFEQEPCESPGETAHVLIYKYMLKKNSKNSLAFFVPDFTVFRHTWQGTWVIIGKTVVFSGHKN
jgi:hypothetical protein